MPHDPNWTCRRCGAHQWVQISLSGPIDHGGKPLAQCVPCGWVDPRPVPKEP